MNHKLDRPFEAYVRIQDVQSIGNVGGTLLAVRQS